MKISGIYKIVNKVNGKYYIGSSKNIKRRWSGHKVKLNKNEHFNSHLQNSWNKYGKENFEFLIVEKVSEEKRIETEQKYLNEIEINKKNFRILKSLRARLLQALNDNVKKKHTIQFIGCSVKELKSYLESKFNNGMSWENYGRKGWHIDHIIPCAKFDLSKLEEQEKCFHYTNLQPLWWYENCLKGDSIIHNHELLL